MKAISIVFALIALVSAIWSAGLTIINMDFTAAGLASLSFVAMTICIMTNKRS